jgi:hypothetical protein
MPSLQGPSRLFHAIVVAGAALGGACSSSRTLPASDGAVMEARVDGAESDAGSAPDAQAAPDRGPDAGVDRQCDCLGCYPCYV